MLAKLKRINLAAAGYAPLPAQVPIHLARERILLVSGGEGSGKSLVTSAEIVARYTLWELVYIVGPKYDSARKEIDYVNDLLARFGAVATFSRPKTGKCVLVTRERARVETISSEEGPKAVTGTGESPDILAMVEAGKQSYEVYLACRARVARSRGLLILSGTIEASERWYPELVKRWQAVNPEGGRSFILPTWSNTALYPSGEDDPEILALKATYPPDKFMERFGAVPCPPATLVFREFSFVDHVKAAPYWGVEIGDWKLEVGERKLEVGGRAGFPPQSPRRRGEVGWANAPVELAVDPGWAGAYAVLALQWQGDTVWVIDEVYRQYEVAENIILECKGRPWWSLVQGGVIDIAGRQHQGLPSHVEIWQRQAGIHLRSNPVRISDGILRHRTFLRNPLTGKPRLYHDPRCKQTLREYGLYKYREVIDGRPVSEEPIDADNHALKALAYWLYDKFGPTDRAVERRREPVERSDPYRSAYGR